MILTGQGPIYIGTYDPINGKAASGYMVDVQKIGCANTELSTAFTRSTKSSPRSMPEHLRLSHGRVGMQI